jgi:hypothetical protein
LTLKLILGGRFESGRKRSLCLLISVVETTDLAIFKDGIIRHTAVTPLEEMYHRD